MSCFFYPIGTRVKVIGFDHVVVNNGDRYVGKLGTIVAVDKSDASLPYQVDVDGTNFWISTDDIEVADSATEDAPYSCLIEDVYTEIIPIQSTNGPSWGFRLTVGEKELTVTLHNDATRVLNDALHELGVQTR